MFGMYGVTWFPLKSYIRTKSKWVKKKKKIIHTNQIKRIKSKRNVCILILNWKKCLTILDSFIKPAYTCFPPHISLSLNASLFSVNYWKGASGFLLSYETRKIPQVSVDAASLGSSRDSCRLRVSVVFETRSMSPSSHLHPDTLMRFLSPARLIRWSPSSPLPDWRWCWSEGCWAAVGSGCERWCIHSGGSE